MQETQIVEIGRLKWKSGAIAETPKTQKRPRHQRASSVLETECGWLASDRSARNAADVSAVDAEVLQFAAGHAAEFVNGLTILAPVVERACYVHDNPLS